MEIKCYRCGHIWNYKGKHKITKCKCMKNISIKKSLEYMNKPSTIETTDKLSYDRKNKNRLRHLQQEIIKQMFQHKDNVNILTLETRDYLFVKDFDTDKYKFYIAECNVNEYNMMIENKPNNVILYKGDITIFKELPNKIDCCILDWCGFHNKNILRTVRLIDKIRQSKIVSFTVCLRGKELVKREDDISLIISDLTKLINKPLDILHIETYNDYPHNVMGLIILKIL